jgi:hypothetical protein
MNWCNCRRVGGPVVVYINYLLIVVAVQQGESKIKLWKSMKKTVWEYFQG